MTAPPKLTKKQKKAVAFRERKQGRGGKDAVLDEDDNDVPVSEDQALAEVQDPGADGKDKDKSAKEGAKAKGDAVLVVEGRKRKREEAEKNEGAEGEGVGEGGEGEKRKRKRKKGADGAAERTDGDAGQKKGVNQRFLLFVGNLRYTTSLEAIKEHFAACDPPPSVRLLTPKATPQKPTTAKSKGCAFLEFSHRNALQQALKLHQSELDGRRINVELTAGGGGKSETRLVKVRERNKELHGQRVHTQTKRMEKAGDAAPMQSDRPQRYSATSGIEQENTGKRTWTVPDVDDGATHRGGRKHAVRGAKKGQSRSREWTTGANAITVG
ncbi:hypothetical protein PLICRDRAFT_100531 [Plicaturopsis crispa FD-325 SS-3]|nr:hypothetical protein PLICRDRAFT_100531 [Plicaturopsis crispa FD-325 SS-3]